MANTKTQNKNGNGKKEKPAARPSRLKQETKTSIYAVALIAIAVVFLLAPFGEAGMVGGFLFSFFRGGFGIGYYLIPLTLLLIGGHLLTSDERNDFLSMTFGGALAFVLSGLGFIDIIFPEKAGLVGKFFGGAEHLLGYWAAIVFFFALIIISVLVTLNTSLRFAYPSFFKKAPKEDKDLTVTPPITPNDMTGDEAKPTPAETPKEEEKKAEPEEQKEEKAPSITQKLKESLAGGKKPQHVDRDYVLPPLSLLRTGTEKPTVGDLRANANIIKRTLESFGIAVEMGEITIGPKVTRYTLKPAEGIKLSRITALNQDLSLALAAHPIRIEAPIPGKSLIGIEIPNKVASIVRLGSLLAYNEFVTSSPLTVPLGRDVAGNPIFADIAKMPHVLIAGATGSGKSVTIHALIASLLFKNSPETLRLILIDPKRVELSIYEGIPHLASAVITEGKKAIGALRFCIEEMDRRYETLLRAGSRDIGSYNKTRSGSDRMPYLVLVMDELADLMAAYGREVEGSIVRLAQMARATGIHLVISTQRPSVDVITGLIKANIPSRVALQVASQIDSRTILDTAGAEKLLGGGDMLFLSVELSKPRRVQGAYVTDEELKKVVEFINKETAVIDTDAGGGDALSEDIEKKLATKSDLDSYLESSGGSEDGEDDLFDDAVEVVKKAGKASASLLQRRLRVGYARAARLLDIMEEKGVIGPGDGAKPREVYVRDDSHEQ